MIKTGVIAQLKTGGPEMTVGAAFAAMPNAAPTSVQSSLASNMYNCNWFDDDSVLHTAIFHADQLDEIEADE